jgi:hypothetical protein
MKTLAKNKINLATLFTSFTLTSLLISVQTFAQRDLYFGFESTMSNRKYSVHSDLNNLKGKTILQQGRTYAIIFGSSAVMGKFSLGNFSSSGKDNNPMTSSSTELSFNIGLLQLFSKQDRVIEPYFVSSVETTKVKSAGTFVPDVATPPANTCTCTCTSGGESSLTIVNAPASTKTPEPYSGNFGTTRINLGVGLNVHLSKGNFFLNLFAEAKHGIAAGNTASTQALLYTYALKQLVYSTGMAIGISKDRSHGRFRKHRFR